MSEKKLDKNDKKYIIIILVVGAILQIFIDSGMDISLLVFFMYISHKYLGSVENIPEYNSYEFIDKYKFVKGKKRFVLLMDLYFISRIIYNLINPHSSYVFGEMLLILIVAYIPYENYLTKKYVLNTNATKGKKKLVFVKNKILVSIVLLVLVGLTYFTFNTLNELRLSNYAKYGNYQYNLTNENGYRKIELEIGSHYTMVEENEQNSKYFDDYLRLAKDLLKDKIFKSYVFITMLVMLSLCFIELYPEKNTVNSILSNVFLIIFLISSVFVFSFDTFDNEDELSSYLYNYLNR